MEWRYENLKKEWNLFFEGESVIKLKLLETPKNKVNKFAVKIFFSEFLLSKNKLKKIKGKNQTWLKQVAKKFKTINDMEKYISLKKIDFKKKIETL